MVEFTLCFVLAIVIMWIPANFGLAFYTSQAMQNAAREGARLAAATKNLQAQLGVDTNVSCDVPCDSSNPEVLQATSKRARLSLISTPRVIMRLDGGASCDRLVTVTVTGTYGFSFYQLLRMVRGGSAKDSVAITRQASARWEHQC